MKLRDLTNEVTADRVLGIDASTKSYAWALIEDGAVAYHGEEEFSGSTLYARMCEAQQAAKKLARLNPGFCGIEQAVYVNNRSVVIKLAYFYGIVMGQMAERGVVFDDVSPMTWMSYIGNKRFTKEEKLELKKQHPDETKTWHKRNRRKIRKQRTIDWVEETYGFVPANDNIADAVGVAHYAAKELVS